MRKENNGKYLEKPSDSRFSGLSQREELANKPMLVRV